jgi:hypothetical protein
MYYSDYERGERLIYLFSFLALALIQHAGGFSQINILLAIRHAVCVCEFDVFLPNIEWIKK